MMRAEQHIPAQVLFPFVFDCDFKNLFNRRIFTVTEEEGLRYRFPLTKRDVEGKAGVIPRSCGVIFERGMHKSLERAGDVYAVQRRHRVTGDRDEILRKTTVII